MLEEIGLVNGVVLNHYFGMTTISSKTSTMTEPTKTATDAKNPCELLVCTNTALRLAARRLGNLYDEALAPLGLKSTQVSLLTEITRMESSNGGQAPTLQDLAVRLAIQISALTHALKPLIRDGWVDLQVDKLDRRTKRAVLTPAGVELWQQALVYWATANERVEEVMGSDSAAALRAAADYVASDEFLAAYRGGDQS
jgi:DNA-binding MarR family transcriptional regulator